MTALTVNPRTLRGRIRALREASGLTQEQLAERAGLNEKYIQDLESGRRANPGLDVLNSLALALEVPVYALLYEPEALKKMLE